MRDNEKTWTAKRNMIMIFKSDQRILAAASQYSVDDTFAVRRWHDGLHDGYISRLELNNSSKIVVE